MVQSAEQGAWDADGEDSLHKYVNFLKLRSAALEVNSWSEGNEALFFFKWFLKIELKFT